MALGAWQATAQNELGNRIVNPVVTVRDANGNLATIYSDAEYTALANPFTGTPEGFCQFWAETGEYTIEGSDGSTLTETWYENIVAPENFANLAPFDSRADAEASLVPDVFTHIGVVGPDGTMRYIYDADGTALETADGRTWSPDGDVTVYHFGVVPSSRSDASANSTRINAADAYAASVGKPLYLGSGIIFFGATLTKTTAWIGNGQGYWPVQPAFNRPAAEKEIDVANTQLVAVGTFTRNTLLPGISSMHCSGATRVNPSAVGGLVNDDEYRLQSFMNDDGTIRLFSVGVLDTSKATTSKGFRVVPDFGGDDGQDGYEDDTEDGRSTADVDIGLFSEDGDHATYEHIDTVGHWRMYGTFVAQIKRDEDAAVVGTPYYVTFKSCHFQGYAGFGQRGSDTYKVISVTGAEVRVPWADDIALQSARTWDQVRRVVGFSSFALGQTITNVVQDDDECVITFSGDVSGVLSAGQEIAARAVGGGDSHTNFYDCIFQGFTHSNGGMAHDGTMVADPFPYPSKAFEKSGWRGTETNLINPIIHHIEEVGFHIHDANKLVWINLQLEKTLDQGAPALAVMRLISSANNTTHAPYNSGFVFQFNITSLDAEDDRVDWGPGVPITRPADTGTARYFNDAADTGFLEANLLQLPSFTGSQHYGGAFIRPLKDGLTGFKSSLHPFGANKFYYDDATDFMNASTANLVIGEEGFMQLIRVIQENPVWDAGVELETANYKVRLRSDSSSADARFEIDIGKTGTWQTIWREERGSTYPGFHIERVTHFDNQTNREFSTRTAFTNYLANGFAPVGGMVVSAGNVAYSYMPVGHRLYGLDPIADIPGWVWFGQNTPYHHGAAGDFTTDDYAALAAWLTSFNISREALWMERGVYRCLNHRLTLPEGVIINGNGGPRIGCFPQGGFEKNKLRDGAKGTLSGAVIIFDGTPAETAFSTARTDGRADLNPMMLYNYQTRCRLEGFDIVQNMDVRNAGNTAYTTALTDNRASGYDCGLVNLGYGSRVNIGIFGYLPQGGFVNVAKVGDSISDPDYVDLSGSLIASGVVVIGAKGATPDGGNTGCKGSGVEITGSDHHTRADTDPDVPVLFVDGDTGGANTGIRGVSFSASSLRGYANDAVVLVRCDDFSLVGSTTEFSDVAGVTGLDAEGVITGTAETGNVTLVGVAATGNLGLADLADAISGKFTFAQSGGLDALVSGKGGAGVAGNTSAVRIYGNDQNDSVIQLTSDISSATTGWQILRDLSASDKLDFRYNGSSLGEINTSGRIRSTRFSGRPTMRRETCVLSANAITVTDGFSLIQINNSGAAGTLNTINGTFEDGDRLILDGLVTADVITISNSGGNIRCHGGADIVINGGFDWIELLYIGGTFRTTSLYNVSP
jgi:hypothetical protein